MVREHSGTTFYHFVRSSVAPDCDAHKTWCGFHRDCSTSDHAIQRAVSLSRVTTGQLIQEQQDRSLSAERACAISLARNESGAVLSSGGWCLSLAGAQLLQLRGGVSYLLPKHHVKPDPRTLMGLLTLLRPHAKWRSLVDLGAGVGQYGRALEAAGMPPGLYTGYDGAGNVASFTRGYVRFADLAVPSQLQRADFALSLEVGEHIPAEQESGYIRNLDAHNCRGVIMSWGELNQAGHAHINNHGVAWLQAVFTGLGYRNGQPLNSVLKQELSRFGPTEEQSWLSKARIFYRVTPLHAAGCSVRRDEIDD